MRSSEAMAHLQASLAPPKTPSSNLSRNLIQIAAQGIDWGIKALSIFVAQYVVKAHEYV